MEQETQDPKTHKKWSFWKKRGGGHVLIHHKLENSLKVFPGLDHTSVGREHKEKQQPKTCVSSVWQSRFY